MTGTADSFESPRLLLEGAARHLGNLEARIEAFQSTDWADIVGNSPGEVHIKVKGTPPEFKQIAYDFLNNLRSALDHAVYAAAFEITGEELGRTKFPFGLTEDDAWRDARGINRKVPKELIDFLLAFKPYRDGNPLLFGLNGLRNTKSHRVLVPFVTTIGMHPGSVHAQPPEATAATHEAHDWNPATGVFKVSLDAPPDAEIVISSYVFRVEMLIGTGAFRGEQALRVFDSMASEVGTAVADIEAEAQRLRGL